MSNKITNETLITGIIKSEENAKELIEEANILLDNNKLARAFTLFQLAIEELGKCAMITNYILEDDKSKINKLLKELKKHKIKTDYSIGYDMMLYKSLNEKHKKTLLESFVFNSSNISLVDDYKNYSLYTSIINNEFKKPSEIITLENVQNHKFYAEIRLNVAKELNRVNIDNFPTLIEARKEVDFEKLISDFIENEKDIIKKAQINLS